MNKYTVLKNEDIKHNLSLKERDLFERLIRIINRKMVIDNKYAVINLDEPYSFEITDIMKKYGHWED